MKNVLITGATGFIGSHLVTANLEKGNHVRAFHLPGDPGRQALENKGVETFEGDISQYESVQKAASGMDVIFHCAAVCSSHLAGASPQVVYFR